MNLIRTTQILSSSHDEIFKPYEITASQYNVLRILRGAGDDGLKCSEIGDRMVTKDSDITRLLDRLEARKLVKRKRDSKDRRIINVCIAEKGLQLLADLDEPMTARSKELFAHFTPAQLDQLNELLVLARKQVV